jgi:hypothetical protein
MSDSERAADRSQPCPAPALPPQRTGTDGTPAEAAMTEHPSTEHPSTEHPSTDRTSTDRTGEQRAVTDITGGRRGQSIEISVDQAIALREQAPEMYDLWLRIAQEKAATSSYVERAPYEIPERLAQSGRPRALGALVIVLSFCGYLAWLGGPGPYIGGLIAILDLAVMFGMFFGLRPERLPDAGRLERHDRARLAAG